MDNLERLNELGTAPIGKLLWKYSLPAVVGIVVMSIYNVIDRIFIGQGVGPDAIAGLAITFPVMNVSVAFGVLIGAGASARTSIVLGQGNKRMAEEILGNSIVMTLLFGTFYVGMFALFMDPVLRLFGASDRSLPYAHDFMMYILPGLLMNNLCFSYNNVMRATGYPTKAMITMFIGAGLNVILAPIFIFVLGWGIKGAAIATDISMGISAAFVLLHFCNKKNAIHFKRGTFRLRRKVLMPIIAIGAAPCIVNTAGCLVNAIINNTVYRYGGDSSVAAIGIFVTLTQLLVTFVIGVCMGMQPIVGYNYGARHFDRLKKAFWLVAAVSTLACGLGTLAGQVCPRAMARIFTNDIGLLDASEHALRITTSMFWVAGFQIVATNFFQSLGAAGKSIFMSLTRQIIFLIPMLFTLPNLWKLDGVWMSFPFSDAAAVIVAAVLLAIEMRQITKMEAQQKLKLAQ
ncbi:MAG: MATE family efflux transporter [Bacteroidales bacterium]|nr:MATE family efflux transporter [Candidatus Sodaliphilus aphodohippi]